MGDYSFERFLDECTSCTQEFVSPTDIVLELSPLLQQLIENHEAFLKPEHFQDHKDHYARNLVYNCPAGNLSLFTMVWNPGQWTPVHDHGTWGVVGIIKGVLEERSFIRVDGREREDSGIILKRGGNVLLSPGSVTTFVPNPDHIHRTGVARRREQAISLHLYGRAMNNYHIYDLELGRRRKIELESNLKDEIQTDTFRPN